MTVLGELGLSSYEEKVYRTLLVTGKISASKLSDRSEVPKGRIYDVLNGLESRKLVVTLPGEPTKYKSVDPEVVIGRLLTERTSELKQEWNRYQMKAAKARSALMPKLPTESSFWFRSLGNEQVVAEYQQHMETTELFYVIIGRPYENASWERIRTEIEAFFEGASESLSANIIVSEPLALKFPDSFPAMVDEQPVDIAIRTVPDVNLSFNVVDQAETTIEIPHPVVSDDRLGVVRVREQRVVEKFVQYFEHLWDGADPLLE